MTKLNRNPKDSGGVGTYARLQKKDTASEEKKRFGSNENADSLVVSVCVCCYHKKRPAITNLVALSLQHFSHPDFNFAFLLSSFIHPPPCVHFKLIPQITGMLLPSAQ